MPLGLVAGVRTQGQGWTFQEVHHCATHVMVAYREKNAAVGAGQQRQRVPIVLRNLPSLSVCGVLCAETGLVTTSLMPDMSLGTDFPA